MDDYLNSFREMLSLRGLTEHTVTSYSTYISAYLQYLSDIIHTSPEDVSWQELRDFISWLQKTRGLSDRTVNACISQLRFFTLYVLHKPWDPYQLPFRKFDSYVPFIPTREEMQTFLASISNLKFKALLCLMFSAGLRIGEVRHLKCSDIEHSRSRIHIRASKNRSDRYAQLSETPGNSSSNTGIPSRQVNVPVTGSSRKRLILPDPSTTSGSLILSVPMRRNSAGNTVLPVTPSGMHLQPIIMRTGLTCSL